MIKPTISQAKLDEFRLLANDYIDVDLDHSSLWRLCEKGFLFKLFKISESDNSDYLVKFQKVVSKTLNSRFNVKPEIPSGQEIKGAWLYFDPTLSMYDGISDVASEGFFDSDDVPPPELWIGVNANLLVSFIPEKYLSRASLGVNDCVSGSLSWADSH